MTKDNGLLNMDWTRHAKKKTRKVDERRLSLPVSDELQKAIEYFKTMYSKDGLEFTDTSVLMTFIEAGVRHFIVSLQTKGVSANESTGE